MAIQPKLHLSPFVLSTVMFDNSNSFGDQEGFLIGNAQKCVRREISDQSMYNTEEDLIISIYSCIPCGSYLSFYDSCGNVKEDVVDDFLGERKKAVVGWYRYRRNLVAFPSAREMIVHKNLRKFFAGNIFFSDEHFVFGVFGSACYPTTATHTYDYAFFIQKAESFRSLGITLLNLGDTKTEYRGGSLSSSFINSSTFDSVLEIPWDFSSCWQTEDAMQQMHKMLREKCDSLAEELAASESVNSIIEQEVQKLDSELESLTIKAKPPEPVNREVEMENSENIPPETAYIPFSGKHGKLFGKRNLKDLIDLNEELHPLYGKYFPQNRPQEPGSSFHFSGEVSGINYNFLPPKKKIKVILQERRRIMDHDYDFGTREEPPQCVPEVKESSNAYETGYLSSEAAGYLHEEIQFNETEDFAVASNIAIPSTSSAGNTKDTQLKNDIKIVYLEGVKNIPGLGESELDDENILCPEAIVEEIVETAEPEDSNLEPIPDSDTIDKASNVSDDEDVPKTDVNKNEPNAERHGKPVVIYCKPTNKDETTSDSEN
ncbi:BRISC complex subunit Abraxas 2 [Trichonephila clavata]|uniref:BRISC complex subunit Abraxas 2 n=1 Tax=Trichonephila clavata TaxID=2740835 RepID=A0A8X6LZ51_TRICU|nr:BRISC complex subunit Abraxas 2 [Trichonephila clavata]